MKCPNCNSEKLVPFAMVDDSSKELVKNPTVTCADCEKCYILTEIIYEK